MKNLRSFLLLNLAAVLFNGGAYAYQLLASRGLDVAEFGLWTVLSSLTIVAVIPGLAVNLVVARTVAELAPARGEEIGRHLRQLSRRIGLILGGLLIMSFLPVLSGQSSLLGVPIAVFPLFGVAVASTIAWTIPIGTLQGLERFEALSVAQISRPTLMILFGAVFLALSPSVIAVVAGLGAGTLCSLALGVVATMYNLRSVRTNQTGAGAATDPRHHGAAGFLPTLASFGLITVMLNLDTSISRLILNPEDTGYYGVLAVAGRSVFYAPIAIHTMLVPKVAARHVGNRDTRPLLGIGLALTVLIALPLILIFATMPELVLSLLFGATYGHSPVVHLLPRYAIAQGLLALSNFLLYYFLASRRHLAFVALGIGLAIQVVHLLLIHNSPDDMVNALLFGFGTSTLILVAMSVREAYRGPVATTPAADSEAMASTKPRRPEELRSGPKSSS